MTLVNDKQWNKIQQQISGIQDHVKHQEEQKKEKEKPHEGGGVRSSSESGHSS